MALQTHKTYCRFCHNYCAMEAEIVDGEVQTLRADASDPVYGGYSCIKGRQLPQALRHPQRVLRPLRRTAQGFDEIASERAFDEIAEKLAQIIARHGPAAVASYCGTYAFQESAALQVARAWHKGIGSHSFYTSVTIDQPNKMLSPSRTGVWSAGTHGFQQADVALVVGCNTIVSRYSPFGGITPWNPSKELRAAQQRGLKLIVLDPRRSEVARRADLHLQLRPGEDPTLLAGMLKLILDEKLHDADFCARWTTGLAELHAALGDYSLAYVAARTGVPAEQIAKAARLFAEGPRGVGTSGTGPSMAPRGLLMEHLLMSLNFVCGRVHREGEPVPNPGVLTPPTPKKAQPIAPWQAYGKGPRLRTRGLGEVFGEMPCAALNDEILTPGEGQVRALLCIGGNPAVAWPDQQKTMRALADLELLVCVDVRVGATSRLADYVLPGKLCLERADVPILCDTWFEKPYTHYTPALVAPPDGADAIEEWQLYWELARRLESPIRLAGGELPMAQRPEKEEVLELMLAGSRIPFAEIRKRRGGQVFEQVQVQVAPADADCEARLALAPDGICEELREVRGEAQTANGAGNGAGFSHLLISRRLGHVYNSSGRDLAALREKGRTNPAYLNPADLAALGVAPGALVEIESERAAIFGVAAAADDIPPGVVSMAHAWGDPEAAAKDVREVGASTNRLVDNARHFDPITGMARQSAIPVNIRPAPPAAAA